MFLVCPGGGPDREPDREIGCVAQGFGAVMLMATIFFLLWQLRGW
jgi:hypothetical protein